MARSLLVVLAIHLLVGNVSLEKPDPSINVCTLPSKTGPCRARHTRYFFNTETKACETFIYGGCQGNGNNFESLDDCLTKCNNEKPNPSTDICSLPSKTGPCRARHTRYFFNTETKSCETFVYGGCQGNGNNFESMDDCLTKCNNEKPNPSMNICILPSKTGPCRARQTRYFFNTETKSCETFVYGGCQGNGNNFESLDDCQTKCNNVPMTTTKPNLASSTRATVDVTTASSVCSQPKETGPCRASRQRYYYNTATNACEQFIYGGCKGNKNNFKTIEECTTKCTESEIIASVQPTVELTTKPTTASIPADICSQPKETGPCRASMPRYFYNPETKACERFIYGGCQGNQNNFKTIDECTTECIQTEIIAPVEPTVELTTKPTTASIPADICSQPKETGPCRASMPRYFYNSETKACERFIYGGCQGNQNNFWTEEQCKTKCAGTELPSTDGPVNTVDVNVNIEVKSPTGNCTLPKETGPCRASMPRYYYNPSTKSCEQFIYGGCKGNKNNFLTVKECKSACQTDTVELLSSAQPVTTVNLKPSPYTPSTKPETKAETSSASNAETTTANRIETAANNVEILKQSKIASPVGITVTTAASNTETTTASKADTPTTSKTKTILETTVASNTDDTPANNLETTSKTNTETTAASNRGTTPANNLETPSGTKTETTTTRQSETTAASNTAATPAGESETTTASNTAATPAGESETTATSNTGAATTPSNTKTTAATETEIIAENNIEAMTVSGTNICSLPQETGPCRASFTRYYFNSSANTCQVFTYGGCKGNKNNFKTVEECSARCAKVSLHSPKSDVVLETGTTAASATSICSQPKKTGPCRARKPRYYYNSATKMCEKFTYGGCQGNENNFKTVEECTTKCLTPDSVLSSAMPPTDTNKTSISECPKVTCNTVCIHGYDKDDNNCQTCRCKPTPDEECPETFIANKECGELLFPECDIDSDCQPRMKCCAHGCTKSCILPKRDNVNNSF